MLKRSVIMPVLFLIVLVMPLISAIEFNMKTEYSQGETIISKVSGNFIKPIQEKNILLKRGHVQVPATVSLTNIEGDSYFYLSLLGKEPGNYSVVITGAEYMSGASVITDDIVKNFTIINETADFTITPGVIYTDKDFSIEAQNLLDGELTINIKFNSVSGTSGGFLASIFKSPSGGSAENQVILKSGEVKKINFAVSNVENSIISYIELSSGNLTYSIPIYIFSNGTSSKDTGKFAFESSELNLTLPTNYKNIRTISLSNPFGDLENVSIIISKDLIPYISVNHSTIKMKNSSSEKIELTINSTKDVYVEGKIKAKVNDSIYADLDVYLTFIKDYVPIDDGKNSSASFSLTCDEMDGNVCSSDEECSGETLPAKDDSCCIGECSPITKRPTGKIIGWFLVALIAGFLAWFFKTKYNRV